MSEVNAQHIEKASKLQNGDVMKSTKNVSQESKSIVNGEGCSSLQDSPMYGPEDKLHIQSGKNFSTCYHRIVCKV